MVVSLPGSHILRPVRTDARPPAALRHRVHRPAGLPARGTAPAGGTGTAVLQCGGDVLVRLPPVPPGRHGGHRLPGQGKDAAPGDDHHPAGAAGRVHQGRPGRRTDPAMRDKEQPGRPLATLPGCGRHIPFYRARHTGGCRGVDGGEPAAGKPRGGGDGLPGPGRADI